MDWELTDEQDRFLSEAIDEYNSSLAEYAEKYAFTKSSWNYNQDDGMLVLTPTGGGDPIKIKADIAGTFYKPDGTWEWAWNNPNVEEHLGKRSRAVKEWGEQQGLSYFSEGIVDILRDENAAAYLAAVAQKITGSPFVFRGNAGAIVVYLLAEEA